LPIWQWPKRRRDLPRPPQRDRQARVRAELDHPVAAAFPARIHQTDVGDDLAGLHRLLPRAADGGAGPARGHTGLPLQGKPRPPEPRRFPRALPQEPGRALPAAAAEGCLYKGINASLINDIFDLLYRKNLEGPCPTRLMTNTELVTAEYDSAGDTFTLGLRQREQGKEFRLTTRALILATGYRYE